VRLGCTCTQESRGVHCHDLSSISFVTCESVYKPIERNYSSDNGDSVTDWFSFAIPFTEVTLVRTLVKSYAKEVILNIQYFGWLNHACCVKCNHIAGIHTSILVSILVSNIYTLEELAWVNPVAWYYEKWPKYETISIWVNDLSRLPMHCEQCWYTHSMALECIFLGCWCRHQGDSHE
jgi:hypothetical protein